MDQRTKEVAPGVRMRVLKELDGYLYMSKYSTRGRTFQEQTLSNRCIFSVNDPVHFRRP
ncbi:uncharacterized protein BDW43DRAFT_314983 [Aspergillus alliaceus]|uniref:uncharacterized protein n=1 Tax=Petromyces alliaceus TaxID=209559 RepID=UPI0012A56E79|nr:uncharacterized protein BDW43DRAFT_314983 [Aspergillus alliaceus]KAB8229404.1 hypothetical protein BDW43DRAFT_314983 [Aspergillus alliaceus]